MALASRKIGKEYNRILQSLSKSGAGYLSDKILRQLTIEYTHRYASSGVYTQPVSFNYFEPFSDLKLIDGSVAPYMWPVREVDHLFGIADFFDFVTSSYNEKFTLSQLMTLPDSITFHYTPSGSMRDFTFLNADGREFLIAGFSIVRRGGSVHWYLIVGEIFSDEEWLALAEQQYELGEGAPPHKQLFLQSMMKERGNMSGPPVALEGTNTALKTVIAGEIDLSTSKHISRCLMKEYGNTFSIICDDPDVLITPSRDALLEHMRTHIDSAAAMWGLAEALLQLPSYFAFRFAVTKTVTVSGGKKINVKAAKGGRGLGARFKHVSAIEVVDDGKQVLWPFTPPHYRVETEGHWRRLEHDSFGVDRRGNPIRGKTWVKAASTWRERQDEQKTIYVKSSVAAARIKREEYINAALDQNSTDHGSGERGVLYVLRCLAMKEEVYKVGWTSGTAEDRAKELSSATGVPSSFSVVAVWKHLDPEGLETCVHAMLSPYRISDQREFFEVPYETISRVIEAEIARTSDRISAI